MTDGILEELHAICVRDGMILVMARLRVVDIREKLRCATQYATSSAVLLGAPA